MVGLLILLGYMTGTLFTARQVFAAMQDDRTFRAEDDSSIDRVMNAVVSLFTGVFWPLALPITLIIKFPKKTAKQYEKEAEDREARIRDLERELGINANSNPRY